MKKLFLIGAGRSATTLIDYLLEQADAHDWQVTVGDVSEELVRSKLKGHPRSRAIRFDIHDAASCIEEIRSADLVLSLLPAHLHADVARTCVDLGRSLVTASYVSPAMQELHEQAVFKGILLLNECGLDPGIDHMSAMEVFREIEQAGGRLEAFYSYTGGLVAPESNNNPWGYKFSWNPRNVILAGQGTASYVENHCTKYIPYNRLFLQTIPVDIPGAGRFDGYANRDSLSYRELYGIGNVATLLRGTLRQTGYCRAWNVFVQLGMTDDFVALDRSGELTYAQLVKSFLPTDMASKSLRESIAALCGYPTSDSALDLVEWTGVFSDQKVDPGCKTPAQALQALLEPAWRLDEKDKDMVAMQHRFRYSLDGRKYERTSSLVVIGKDSLHTAMASTVGLPVGIAAKHILQGTICETGVRLPLSSAICKPILDELALRDIRFKEQVTELT